jgi:Putative 2OG-Fe(II) oxygenase
MGGRGRAHPGCAHGGDGQPRHRLLLQEHEVAAATRFGWKVSAWANLNHAGDWNKMHFHSGSTWSGTYYVAGGDPAPPDRPGSGNLAFLDPLLVAQMIFFSGILPQFHEVRPRPGLMVLFPSYLQHIVHPYLGERPRIHRLQSQQGSLSLRARSRLVGVRAGRAGFDCNLALVNLALSGLQTVR